MVLMSWHPENTCKIGIVLVVDTIGNDIMIDFLMPTNPCVTWDGSRRANDDITPSLPLAKSGLSNITRRQGADKLHSISESIGCVNVGLPSVAVPLI